MTTAGRLGRPGVPRRSADQVRRALLDSATVRFARHGYGGTSTKDIAHGAGTSETAIYQHFGSKAELFRVVVLEPFRDFLESYTAAFRVEMDRGHDDDALMRICISHMYDHFDRHRDSLLALIAATGEPDAEPVVRRAIELMNEMYAQLQSLTVERWQEGGGFTVDHIKIFWRMIAGITAAYTALEPLFVPTGFDRPSREQLIQVTSDVLLHGMVPTGTARPRIERAQ